MNAVLNYRYSLLAGACAAGGSFFGKLPGFLESLQLLEASFQDMNPQLEFLLLKALPIVLMVLCNLLNWRYFLRALQAAQQTLTATVLTAASNYMVSFILGTLFYREPISTLTILGSSLMIIGLWFLCGEPNNDDDDDDKHVKLKKT